jgi:hypothetical protein
LHSLSLHRTKYCTFPLQLLTHSIKSTTYIENAGTLLKSSRRRGRQPALVSQDIRVGYELSTMMGVILGDIRYAAKPKHAWLLLVLELTFVTFEATGGLLFSFAAQVHVAPVGPLRVSNAPERGALITLATFGGLLLGMRMFSLGCYRLLICILGNTLVHRDIEKEKYKSLTIYLGRQLLAGLASIEHYCRTWLLSC